MKIPIVILAVLGLACGKSIPETRTLQDDLNDFLALVPTDEVLAIALDYLANDVEVQEAMIYLQSEKFHTIVLTIEGLQETKNFLEFIDNTGLDIYLYLDELHDLIGLPPYVPKHSIRRGVGINGLIDDIIAVLPVEDLKALFDEKLQTSPDFQAFIASMQSEQFAVILETLRALPEYQDLLEGLREKGVDVDAIINLLKALIGISRRGTRTLQDDLDDFVALLPVDVLLGIALDYLANDAEVQEFMVYLQSPPFHLIITTEEALPEFKNFVDFIVVHGVDAYGIINTVHDILGLPPYGSKYHTRRGVGINGLLQDVIANLPLDELKALFDDKKGTSPDFQDLLAAIQGPEFTVIVNTLHALPEYNSLLDDLRAKGVDVDGIIAALRELFGLPPL